MGSYRTLRLTRLSRTMAARLMLGAFGVAFAGCGTAPSPPIYSQADLKAMCERQGGWWRADLLSTGGLCEIQAPGGGKQ